MANVSVANTPGLYIGSGAASILNSAQQLDSLLANSASVGFYLTANNTQVAGTVLASGVTAGTYGNASVVPQITISTDGRVTGVANITISGGGAGSYGNANVAAYLPTDPNINAIWSNISLTNANISAANVNITTLFANAATQETEISGLRANIIAANAAIISTNANVTAANAAIVTVQNNLNAFETYANIHFGDSNYGNSNVAAYLASNISTPIGTTANVYAGNILLPNNGTFYGNLVAANILVANIGIQSYTTYNTPATPGYGKGVMWYDNTQDSLAYYNGVVNNTIHIGQETQFQAYNNSGSTIVQGAPVYISGAFGSWPNVTLAQASSLTSSIVAGVANQNIPSNSYGYIVSSGLVANINLVSYQPGDNLYLSSSTPGVLQNYPPATGYITRVGIVSYNAAQGRFLVNLLNPVNNQYYGNLTLTGNLSANNASITNQLSTGSVLTSGAVTATGTVTAGNVISTGGYFWANGAVYSTGSGTTYSNANVASYLPTYSGNIGGGGSGDLTVQAASGNFFNKTTGFGNIYYQPASGSYINFNGPTVATANIQVNSGSYFIGDGSKLTNITTGYGNSNVATFLSSGFGSNTITTTGNISAGYITGTLLTANQPNITTLGTQTNIYTTGLVSALNIIASNYITANGVGTFGNVLTTNGVYWASNGAPYSSGGNYGNTQVAAYLLAPGPIGQTTPNSGSFAGLTATGATSLGNVTVTGNLTVNNQGTFANVASTNGYFWSNGTAYSTSTGSATFFSGNLAGNVLYDGVNNRIIANAYPLSTPSATWAGNVFTNQIAVKPTYTGTNTLQPPSSGNQIGQIVGQVVSGNIGYQSRYGTQTSAQTMMGYLQSWPVTANTMNNNDRIRAIQGVNEVNLNGYTWGSMTTAANTATTLVGTSGLSQIVGSGQAAAVIGTLGAIISIPVTGSANIQYATNFMATTSYNATNAYTASNIAYARMLGGTLQQTGNLTIQNAVGLHTTTGWATATNKYTVLNDDPTSVIQTSGNVAVTGNIKMQAYQETVYATGLTGGAVAINVSNGTIQSLTLTGNITSLSFTGMPAGGSVSLIITQGGSGSYTLTTTGIKYAGGNSTLSTAVGAIDILNVLFDGTTYYASLVNGYA